MQGPGGPGGPPPPPSYTPQGFGRPAVQSSGIMRAAPPPAPSQQPQDPEALLEEKVTFAGSAQLCDDESGTYLRSLDKRVEHRHGNGNN